MFIKAAGLPNKWRNQESLGSLFGLCLISASTLIVEIVLTKFLSFKFFHHLTFVMLSLVILSFGASGILTYTHPKLFGLQKPTYYSQIACYALLYAIVVSLVIPLFAWLPLSPYDKGLLVPLRIVSMPLIYLILALPFFFAGICISQTLTKSQHRVSTIYCWDLLAAAAGTALAPILLSHFGGYGSIAFAAFLGLMGAMAYWMCGNQQKASYPLALLVLAFAAIAMCLLYPLWSTYKYGIDILTFKENGPKIVLRDFGGIAKTHWNAIARVDISQTGTSTANEFRYGLSPVTENRLLGRYILLDGGANTRQFRVEGELHKQRYLYNSLWASPYIIKPNYHHTLIIGGGGGIDILVGKFFKAPQLTVIEMNPAIISLLKGDDDEHNHAYTHELLSNAFTKVNLVHDEARHFSTIQETGKFDILQASGVDTLTAIQTGGMSLTENYLYTVEAVRDYMRILKPDGILSLTHWRTPLPGTSLRMFTTYLAYLDSIKVKYPARQLYVLGTEDWTDSLLKGTPFTNDELERIRKFAKQAHLSVIFDPDQKVKNTHPHGYENWYYKLAYAEPQMRKQLIHDNIDIPSAVYDDKPYFYSFNNSTSFWVRMNQSQVSISLILFTMTVGFFLIALPVFFRKVDDINKSIYWFIVYFSICGFAFLLYETTIIQLFSIFVGGPTYALSIVLVAILAGYGMGSACAARLKLKSNTFAFFGIVLCLMSLLLYWLIPIINHVLLPLTLPQRLLITSLVSGISSALIGATIASAMSVVRNRYGDMVSWMWGVGSVANAIGSICFIAITQMIGISSCLLIVAALYLLANLLFSFLYVDDTNR